MAECKPERSSGPPDQCRIDLCTTSVALLRKARRLRPPLSPLRSQRRMADDMNYLTRLVADARLHTQVRRRGHGEPEGGALSRLASHANVASVRLDDAAGDEQAQARATRGTARYTVELLE